MGCSLCRTLTLILLLVLLGVLLLWYTYANHATLYWATEVFLVYLALQIAVVGVMMIMGLFVDVMWTFDKRRGALYVQKVRPAYLSWLEVPKSYKLNFPWTLPPPETYGLGEVARVTVQHTLGSPSTTCYRVLVVLSDSSELTFPWEAGPTHPQDESDLADTIKNYLHVVEIDYSTQV